MFYGRNYTFSGLNLVYEVYSLHRDNDKRAFLTGLLFYSSQFMKKGNRDEILLQVDAQNHHNHYHHNHHQGQGTQIDKEQK